jgi:DNA-binding transcriptional LysR family regulator
MILTVYSVVLYDRGVLDTHRLRVFRAVVAAGSVHGAAERLGYTPSAVSQHVAALQQETGLTLVERRGRGIAPTAAGLRLAEEAASVLERLAALESVAGDLREGRVGSLTMSYVASAGMAWLPGVVAALTREFPALRLDLRLVELSRESTFVPDIEVFVAGAPSGGSAAGGYDELVLLEESYLVVVPQDHPLAAHHEVPLARLREEPWVDNDISRGPCRQVVIDACATAGFAPAFQVQAHDYQTALAFVAAGVGVTVLPRLGAVALPAGVVAIPVVDPEPRRRVMLRVRRAVREQQPVVRAVGLLREHAAATASDIPSSSRS